MAKAFDSYPWYIEDWRSNQDIIAMSIGARGLYRELLDVCWRDGSLPTSEDTLAKLANVSRNEFETYFPEVRPFFRLKENRFRNVKVDEKRPQLLQNKTNRQAAAKKLNGDRYGDRDGDRDGDRLASRAGVLRPPSTVLDDTEETQHSSSSTGPPPQQPLEPTTIDDDRVVQISAWLTEYTGGRWGKPDRSIVMLVIRAMGTATLADLKAKLLEKLDRGHQPGQSWAWFVRVLENEFGTTVLRRGPRSEVG